MSANDAEALARENQFLKQRVAQLQGDVDDLSAEVERLRQRLEHGMTRRPAAPDPLSGGQ